MLRLYIIIITVFLVSCSGETKKNSSVYFENIKDGDTVSQTFKVKMGVKGMTVKPAGEIVEGTGHHHIIIDGSFIPKDTIIPADETHIHYGKGQTETELTLSPGKHTLTMQFANGVHSSYGENMSKTIAVVVE